MLNVGVFAYAPMKSILMGTLMSQPDIYLSICTSNVREVFSHPFGPSDILIVEDQLLKDNQSVQSTFARLTCRKFLIGITHDLACARRAISLGAVDVVEEATAGQEIMALLEPYVRNEVDRPSEVIAVYSAKGGVGKTTLALNLAWAMADMTSHPVALLDMDIFGDIGSMLLERPPISIVDVIQGLENGMSEDKALQSLFMSKKLGLTIVPASTNPQQAEIIRRDHISQVINMVKTTHAYVILDLPAGLTENNLAALDAADQIVVVALPEQVSLKTVARSMEILERLYAERLTIALNRTDSGTGITSDDVGRMLGRSVSFSLASGGVAPVKYSNQGIPLVQADRKNALSVDILRMANYFVTESEGLHRPRLKPVLHSTKS